MSLVLKTEKGTFTVRKPQLDDVTAAMDFVNSLVDEDAMILANKKVTYEEERRWLLDELDGIARLGDIKYFVFDETSQKSGGGKIVASVGIQRGRLREAHTAEYAIAVASGYRRLGIAETLSRYIIKETKKSGVKVLTLRVFENNKGAIRLYKKLGFRKEALLKKRVEYKKKYLNVVVMVNLL